MLTILTIEKFISKHLNDGRRIRVVLPPCYRASVGEPYPVLYVHDGQNLFADQESFSGQAWQLDRIVDDLMGRGRIRPIILVAIDHAGTNRLAEFAHQQRNFQGQSIKARGIAYEAFLVDELKPFIDRHFSTDQTAPATALMGSSMGGLVSLNIGLRRSNVFGSIAALSPSFWWNPTALQKDLDTFGHRFKQLRLWLDIGGREGEFGREVAELAAHISHLSGNDTARFRFFFDPQADHSETAWRNRVHLPLEFMFAPQ